MTLFQKRDLFFNFHKSSQSQKIHKNNEIVLALSTMSLKVFSILISHRLSI